MPSMAAFSKAGTLEACVPRFAVVDSYGKRLRHSLGRQLARELLHELLSRTPADGYSQPVPAALERRIAGLSRPAIDDNAVALLVSSDHERTPPQCHSSQRFERQQYPTV